MKKNICIVENLSDLKILKDKIERYENLDIFTLNYATHKLLERNGIEHKIGEYHLTPENKKDIDQMAIETTLTWWKEDSVKKSLTVNNIIIPEFIEMELLQYFVTIYKSAKNILRIIEDVIPDEVICMTNINPFVKLICNQMNLEFSEYSNGETLSLHYDRINIKYNIGPIPLSFTTSRNNYKRIKGLTEKISQKSFRLNPKNKRLDNKGILLLEFNPITYESLIKELGKEEKNIFILNQRRPAVFNKKSLEIIKNSNCKIIDLGSFEKEVKSEIKEKIESFNEILERLWNNDSLFERCFIVESHSLWNSIKPVFSKMCSQRFLESIKRILLLEEFFSQFNISKILEWAETGQEEREILAVSKKYGIKAIMLQHSMFPIGEIWKPFSRFLANFSHNHISDYQAVWGKMTYEYAISNNHVKEKLFLTGSPRHDSFFSLEKNHSKTKKILLATTGPPAIFTEDSTTDAFLKHDEFIKEIFRVIKKNHPEKELIVKPHPQSDFMNNAISFIKETDSNVKIVLEGDLSELINDCDLVISFNTSTILLESIIMEKPTISIITEEWAKENEIIKMNGVISVRDMKDVESSISKIISDEDYNMELRSNSKQFLENYLVNHGMASKHLVEVLKKI